MTEPGFEPSICSQCLSFCFCFPESGAGVWENQLGLWDGWKGKRFGCEALMVSVILHWLLAAAGRYRTKKVPVKAP